MLREQLLSIWHINLKKKKCSNSQPACKDRNCLTPLHYAVIHSHLDIIQELAHLECDLVVSDNSGQTPLHYAIKQGDIDISSVLITDVGCDLGVTESIEKILIFT